MNSKEFNDWLLKIKYDKAAVAKIYEEYVAEVKLHVSCRFGNAVDAEDIAHEVFLKLMLIDWSKYEAVKSPEAWLNKIADHIALDKIKSKHIDYSLEQYENIFTYFDLDNTMIADEIKAVLKYLDPITAEIIYLNRYEGYKFKDIATLMSMNPIAVRVRASRGYKKLKKICNKLNLNFV